MHFFYIFAPRNSYGVFYNANGFFVFTPRVERLIMLNFFILTLSKQKTIFTMKNLTLLQLIFALALVCKWGEVGKFSTMGWGWVFLPLVLHYVLQFGNWVASFGNFRGAINDELNAMRTRKMQRRYQKIYDQEIKTFKDDLNAENSTTN